MPKKKRRPATHHGVRRYCPRIPGNSMPEFPGLTWGYVQRSNRPSPYLVSFYHNVCTPQPTHCAVLFAFA